MIGGETFKTFGECSIKLNAIANILNEPFQGGIISIPLSKCAVKGASVFVKIIASLAGEVHYVDITKY